MATTIGNYLLEERAVTPLMPDEFMAVVYKDHRGRHDGLPGGETDMPQGSQRAK